MAVKELIFAHPYSVARFSSSNRMRSRIANFHSFANLNISSKPSANRRLHDAPIAVTLIQTATAIGQVFPGSAPTETTNLQSAQYHRNDTDNKQDRPIETREVCPILVFDTLEVRLAEEERGIEI